MLDYDLRVVPEYLLVPNSSIISLYIKISSWRIPDMSFIDRTYSTAAVSTKDMAKIHIKEEGEPRELQLRSVRSVWLTSNIISRRVLPAVPTIAAAQKKEKSPPLLPVGTRNWKIPFSCSKPWTPVRIHVKMHSYESLLFKPSHRSRRRRLQSESSKYLKDLDYKRGIGKKSTKKNLRAEIEESSFAIQQIKGGHGKKEFQHSSVLMMMIALSYQDHCIL